MQTGGKVKGNKTYQKLHLTLWHIITYQLLIVLVWSSFYNLKRLNQWVYVDNRLV